MMQDGVSSIDDAQFCMEFNGANTENSLESKNKIGLVRKRHSMLPCHHCRRCFVCMLEFDFVQRPEADKVQPT